MILKCFVAWGQNSSFAIKGFEGKKVGDFRGTRKRIMGRFTVQPPKKFDFNYRGGDDTYFSRVNGSFAQLSTLHIIA